MTKRKTKTKSAEREPESRHLLSRKEISAARSWWKHLPDADKGRLSIWILLAMYARDHRIERDRQADGE